MSESSKPSSDSPFQSILPTLLSCLITELDETTFTLLVLNALVPPHIRASVQATKLADMQPVITQFLASSQRVQLFRFILFPPSLFTILHGIASSSSSTLMQSSQPLHTFLRSTLQRRLISERKGSSIFAALEAQFFFSKIIPSISTTIPEQLKVQLNRGLSLCLNSIFQAILSFGQLVSSSAPEEEEQSLVKDRFLLSLSDGVRTGLIAFYDSFPLNPNFYLYTFSSPVFIHGPCSFFFP